MKKGVLFGFLVVLFLRSLILSCQRTVKPPPTLEHEVKVELAVVEVFVKDKKGDFVDDLKKEDFEIYEDGKRVDIQYFALVKPKKDIERERIVLKPQEEEKPLPSPHV